MEGGTGRREGYSEEIPLRGSAVVPQRQHKTQQADTRALCILLPHRSSVFNRFSDAYIWTETIVSTYFDIIGLFNLNFPLFKFFQSSSVFAVFLVMVGLLVPDFYP